MNIKQSLFVATFGEDAIRIINEYKLGMESNHLCISYMLDEENRQDTHNYIREDLKKSKPCRLNFHGPFTEIIPSSVDPRAVELGMVRLIETWEVVSCYDFEKLIVHSGYIPPIYDKGWHTEKSIKFWTKFLENIGDEAGKYNENDSPETAYSNKKERITDAKDFTLCIENVLEDEPYMLKDLIDGIADSRVKICLDIGHANFMKGDLPVDRWIRVLGDKISHLHLHNNYGDKDSHGSFSEGSMDIERILSTISDFCPSDVTMTLEGRKPLDSLNWLLEKGYI